MDANLLLLLLLIMRGGILAEQYLSIDDLENHISPEDLAEFSSVINGNASTTPEGQFIGNRFWDTAADEDEEAEIETTTSKVPKEVDCFGVGNFAAKLRWLVNLRPDSQRNINTHFYFSTRKQRTRVQVYPGEQFGLEWVDFDPKRSTAVIIHGFMSHSNASWVRNLTNAFLEWGDVNVIAVDWSGGGNTWKYWRAVANTRQVGRDVEQIIRQLMNATGCSMRDFHFVGHSLGAHICSYAASHLGGVKRITGLDPAQPCFISTDKSVLLDAGDADFVDVIHTNGRLLTRLGLGMPDPSGHADFYPNGGMKQPGCYDKPKGFFGRLLPISPTKISQAICSHGRAYVLFTESLLFKNCSFRAHRWDMTYSGVNASLQAACDRIGSCSEMGIRATGEVGGLPRAKGPYFVLTTNARPYCPTEVQRHHPSPLLLRDLVKGFRLDRRNTTTTTPHPRPLQDPASYADPDLVEDREIETTTKKPWSIWKFWKG